MVLTVTHAYVSPIADDPASAAASDVLPSAWNAKHVITGAVTATTYYISASGSDANSGTSPLTPWQTIAKVNATAAGPDVTFLFRGGDTFTGTIIANASGQPGHPVTYGSYGSSTSGTSNAMATISSGTNNGFTITGFDNITIQNLNITGSGIVLNGTNSGVVLTTTTDVNNYNFLNLNVSGYSDYGFWLICGNIPTVANIIAGPPFPGPNPIASNITFRGCTIFNIGSTGIQINAMNYNNYNLGPPHFLSYTNLLVERCIFHDITGLNSTLQPNTGNQFFNEPGSGIAMGGVSGFTMQYCVIHDNGAQSGSNANSSITGAQIYCLHCENVLIQYNEIYNLVAGTLANDTSGIQLDGDIVNAVVQFNYLHDLVGPAFAIGTQSSYSVNANNNNIHVRYNIAASTGNTFTLGFGGAAGAVALYTLGTTQFVANLYMYNNTFACVTDGAFWGGVINDNPGHLGFIQGAFVNNLILTGANSTLFHLTQGSFKFAGNDYFGPQGTISSSNGLAAYISAQGTQYASTSAWLSGVAGLGTPLPQEQLDGAYVNGSSALTSDPLLLGGPSATSGTAELASLSLPNRNLSMGPAAGGYNPGAASPYQLSSVSSVARKGLDLRSIQKFQFHWPFYTYQDATINQAQSKAILAIDFDFKGAAYYGDVIGSLTCTRTGTNSSDLVFSDPMGRSYNTFGANTLRITAGRGLLVEEARTQLLANPTAPATQTVTGLNTSQTLCLWINGPGKVVVTNGTGNVQSGGLTSPLSCVHGNPLNFTMSSNGSATFTVVGTVNAFQLEDTASTNLPSSLITTTTTRPADVVSTSTATTLGNALADALTGAANDGSGTLIWFHQPEQNNVNSQQTLLCDGGNASALYLKSSTNGQGSAFYTSGGLTLQTANVSAVVNQPNAVGLEVLNGASTANLTLNGGVIATGTRSSNPSFTSPIYVGNNNGGFATTIMGYIERIVTGTTSNAPKHYSSTQLQAWSNVTPIAATASINGKPVPISTDFFGNNVPYNGQFSIGAHQPITTGGQVTLNGATPVTVSDTNITSYSMVNFTLATVGGTVGAVPSVKTITIGTGFTVAGTAGDTSTYYYTIV